MTKVKASDILEGVHRISHDAIDDFIARALKYIDKYETDKTYVFALLVDAVTNLQQLRAEQRLRPLPQWDPGAHVYMREAIEALRDQRDLYGSDNKYDRLTLAARNLRDAYEWLWPLLWLDDAEFVTFGQRSSEPSKPSEASINEE